MAIERKKLLKDGVEFFPRTSADLVILDDAGAQNLATKLAEIDKAKVVVDTVLKADSTNAIANKAVFGALSAKVGDNEVGAPAGVAPLDANGLVPAAFLPGFLDDVLDTTFALSTDILVPSELTYLTDTKKLKQNGKEITPEKGKLYICVKDTDAQYLNKQYRWSGSVMTEQSKSIALGDVAGTAFPGNRGKAVETLAASTAEDLSLLHDDFNTFDNELQGVKDVQSINVANYTHAQVVALRDAGQLVPGAKYRIIDYVCTTTQENTRAMPHRFDIIVTALTRNSLSEVASACFHEGGDKYYFARPTVDDANTFTLTEDYEQPTPANATNAHKKAVLKCSDTSMVNVGDVFSTLDISGYINEGTRFDRATPIYLEVESKTSNSVTVVALNGCRIKDILNCVPSLDAGSIVKKCTIIDFVPIQAWKVWYCLDNDIKRFAWADSVNGKGIIYRMIDENHNDCPYDFKNIQFKRNAVDPAFVGVDYLISGDGYYYTFTWVDETNFAFDASIVWYKLQNDESSHSGVYSNVIEPYFMYEQSKYALNDIISVSRQIYDGGTFYGIFANTFGSNCHSNTFGDVMYSNTFGQRCESNVFGTDCRMNTIGSGFIQNKCSNGLYECSLGNECCYNVIGEMCGPINAGYNFSQNVLGNGSPHNSFGDYCANNILGDSSMNNTFGNFCRKIKLGSYCEKNVVSDNVERVELSSTNNGSDKLQNYHISVRSETFTGTYIIQGITINNKFITNVATNSKGEIVQYCEADLAGAIKAVNI